MENKTNYNLFEISNFILTRTPLCSIDRLFNYYNDFNINSDFIIDFFNNKLTKEALLISSPELYERLNEYLLDKNYPHNKKEKLTLSLFKYFNRMHFRCTPFGAMASVSVCNLSSKTNIKIGDWDKIKMFKRLDGQMLQNIINNILEDKKVIKHILWYPNSTIYIIREKIRYIQVDKTDNNKNNFKLQILESNPLILKTLEISKNGISFNKLIEVLNEFSQIEKYELSKFIENLINSQLIKSELELGLFDNNSLKNILEKLRQFDLNNETIEKINELSTNLNEKGIIELYKYIDNNYWGKFYDKKREIFQIDTLRDLNSNEVGNDISNEVLNCFNFMKKYATFRKRNDTFSLFKRQFIDRYGNNFMPLAEVLDQEYGIGYEPFFNKNYKYAKILEGLTFTKTISSNSLKILNIEKFKFDIFEYALNNKVFEVDICKWERSLNKVINPNNYLPDSMNCVTNILTRSEDNDFELVIESGFFGSTANTIIGRFGHVDTKINEEIDIINTHEKNLNRGAIVAEIIHTQDSRLSNVISRPQSREFEIPIINNSTLTYNNQINIDDLLVTVINDEVILFSKKLEKRVIPKLGCAHNFNSSKLLIYRFLCDIQFQTIDNLGWSWGNLDSSIFLPRVRIGKCIISRAKWRINTNMIIKGESLKIEDIKIYLSQINIPAFTVFSQGDQELLIDTSNILCLQLLLSELKKNGFVVLKEYLSNSNSIVKDNYGQNYNAEFVFNIKSKIVKNYKDININSKININKIGKYDLLPGDKCIYYKIYCSFEDSDSILISIFKLCEDFINKNMISRYFFIRYYDPEYHIRFRIFYNENNLEIIFNCLNKLFNHQIRIGGINKVVLDTYKREVERYGVSTIELTEVLFFANSRSILKYLSDVESDIYSYDARWRLSIVFLNYILDEFDFDIDSKYTLTKSRQLNFYKLNNIDSNYRKEFAFKYKTLHEIIENDIDLIDENLCNFLSYFKSELESCKDVRLKLIKNIKESNEIHLQNWILDYIHMFFNRLFINNQNSYETLAYDLMYRYYGRRLFNGKIED